MRRLIFVGFLVVSGWALWWLASRLSSDAVGMLLGVFFGMLAGVPAALLVMAASRAQTPERSPRRSDDSSPYAAYGQMPQMPIIVVSGQGGAHSATPLLPGPASTELQAYPALQPSGLRQFRVVGEKEEFVDEW